MTVYWAYSCVGRCNTRLLVQMTNQFLLWDFCCLILLITNKWNNILLLNNETSLQWPYSGGSQSSRRHFETKTDRKTMSKSSLQKPFGLLAGFSLRALYRHHFTSVQSVFCLSCTTDFPAKSLVGMKPWQPLSGLEQIHCTKHCPLSP